MAKAIAMARDDDNRGNRVTQLPARIKGFLTDVRNEMRKVTFPSRKEVQATTTVVNYHGHSLRHLFFRD